MEHSERPWRGDICRCICPSYNGYICPAGHIHFELDRKRQRAHGQRLVGGDREAGTDADTNANADCDPNANGDAHPDRNADANADRDAHPDRNTDANTDRNAGADGDTNADA